MISVDLRSCLAVSNCMWIEMQVLNEYLYQIANSVSSSNTKLYMYASHALFILYVCISRICPQTSVKSLSYVEERKV